MRRFFMTCLVVFCFVSLAAPVFVSPAPPTSSSWWEERQLTFDTDRNHQLDNNLNWSPDCKWIAYDTRAFTGGIGNTLTLEKVNIDTKNIVVIYTAPNALPLNGFGPGTAAVSFFREGDAVIAIRGLDGVQYADVARFGAIFSPTDGTVGAYDFFVSDARDVNPPFTPGALRGGTHRHEPSGDGKWIGFTYNDQIMKALGNNLRTIGVIKLGTPVDVDAALGNQDGLGFTVLVAKVRPQAEIAWGSDDIFQASDDAWVGEKGYQKPDGTWQRARAFIGRTLTSTGAVRSEVYIVDVPEDITVAGPDGPLEGTDTTFPMPPKGTVQRRLTWSDSNCGGIIRCSLDGSRIAFTRGGQIWLISPLGGAPVQATSIPTGASKPWWDPSGDYIYCVSDNSIWRTNVIEGDTHFGESTRITDPTLYPGRSPDALCVAPDGQWIAFNRSLNRGDDVYVNQVFVVSVRKLATLDVKPGDCLNHFTINSQNKGWIPMAILGSADLDVTAIRLDSISINGVAYPEKKPSVSDVSGLGAPGSACRRGPDGYPDLVLHFDQGDLIEALALDTMPDGAVAEVTVTGVLSNGLPVESTDYITIHLAGRR